MTLSQGTDYVTRHQAMSIAQEAARATIQELAPIVAAKAATEAVTKTLEAMGVNVSDTEHIIQMQVDMAHLRRHRKICEEVPKKAGFAAIGLFVTFLFGAVILALGGHPVK